MADVHPVHHLFPIKKPVFIAFHAVSNLYKGQEKVSDEPDSNPVYPVILSKNSGLYIMMHNTRISAKIVTDINIW